MDNGDFAGEFARILTGGTAPETIESDLTALLARSGYPNELAGQIARMIVENPNDSAKWALEMSRLTMEFAQAQMREESPGMAELIKRLQEFPSGAKTVAELFYAGKYAEARVAAAQHRKTAEDFIQFAQQLPELADDPELERGLPEEFQTMLAQCDALVGLTELKLGNLSEAAQLFDRAIAAIEKATKEQHWFPKVLQARAALYAMLGDFPRAIELIERGLAWTGTLIERHTGGDERTAEAINASDLDLFSLRAELGHLYGLTGRHDEALAIGQRAMEAFSAVPSPNPGNVISLTRSMHYFATALVSTGNATLALATLNDARKIYEAYELTGNPEFLGCLSSIGELLRRQGKLVESAEMLQQAMERWGADEDRDLMLGAELCYQGTVLSAACGGYDQALDMIATAAEIQDSVLLAVLPASTEAQRRTYVDGIRRHLDVLLSLALNHLPKNEAAVARAFGLVLARKGLVAEASATQRRAVLSGRHEALRPSLNNLDDLDRRIAGLVLIGPIDGDARAHKGVLAALRAEREQLELSVSRQLPELGRDSALLNVNAAKVASLLPPGSTLIEFVRFRRFDFQAKLTEGEPEWKEDAYAAFVLPAGAPDRVRVFDLGDAGAVDDLIGQWRDIITGDSDRPAEEGRAAGRRLRAALFDPLCDALGQSERLFIAPDSEIARLPFETLPTDTSGHLIDYLTISYLAAGRDIVAASATGTDERGGALIVADPDFDFGGEAVSGFESGQPFTALAGTRKEGKKLAKLLRGELAAGPDARKSQFVAVQLPRLLHVATHGFFQERTGHDGSRTGGASALGAGAHLARLRRMARAEDPMLRSGLALAGANTWAQGGSSATTTEGVLTAADVLGLDLLDTELVVLSACDTGLGEIRTGDGVYGLRRAFTVAGAKTLVMGLWKVPDEQTQSMMTDFYERLLRGESRADALRGAQLATKSHVPDPYYWGAFICQGDSSPMKFAGISKR